MGPTRSVSRVVKPVSAHGICQGRALHHVVVETAGALQTIYVTAGGRARRVSLRARRWWRSADRAGLRLRFGVGRCFWRAPFSLRWYVAAGSSWRPRRNTSSSVRGSRASRRQRTRRRNCVCLSATPFIGGKHALASEVPALTLRGIGSTRRPGDPRLGRQPPGAQPRQARPRVVYSAGVSTPTRFKNTYGLPPAVAQACVSTALWTRLYDVERGPYRAETSRAGHLR